MISILKNLTDWTSILNAARTTIGKDEVNKEPTSNWKRKLILAEHSPIRMIIIKWKWNDIKYWVSVHLTRHKIGIEHFVKTQRSDRTDINRENLPQNARVNHECIANAQAIINISRKRLCNQASRETQSTWIEFLKELKKVEPELYNACVPDCIYRGHCFELKSCGYTATKNFKDKRNLYKEI